MPYIKTILTALLLSLHLTHAWAAPNGIQRINQAQLMQDIHFGEQLLILDVRSAREFNNGHIPGAINIPHHSLAERINEIAAQIDHKTVVYCEKGVRAKHAEGILFKYGFKQIHHLEGDMSAWRHAELPTEK